MDEKSYQYEISAIKLDVDKKPESRVFHPAPEINISTLYFGLENL
ncbi:hypothetical protein [Photorhabdus luminescens]|nr:hypothetical protein [Photorhabdus luminescens]